MEKRYPKNIMATVCLPWTSNYTLDENLFCENIKLLCQKDIRSLYLFGTAGEGYLPTKQEFIRIASIFKQQTSQFPKVRPMLGVISNSITDIIDKIDAGSQCGFIDFQISFPSWGILSDNEAFTFMHMICDKFPSLNFMHYNNGLRSGKKITAGQYKKLCEEIPNLVAIKQTGATLREVAELMTAQLPLQVFFLEDAFTYASALGECSLLISILNTNYNIAQDYFKAVSDGDKGRIEMLHKEITVFYETLKFLPNGKIDGAYDKLFVKYSFPDYPISLYPPYEGYTNEQWLNFDSVLRKSLPQWF